MDNVTAKIGAQIIDHELPKEEVAPDLEEKINEESIPDGSKASIEQRDVEIANTEIKDPEPIIVPKPQRRGLFGRFTLVAEVEEPKHYPRRTKWYITFVVSLAGVAAPLGSTIIFRKTVP